MQVRNPWRGFSPTLKDGRALLPKSDDCLTDILRREADLDLRQLIAKRRVERTVEALDKQALRECLRDGWTHGEARRIRGDSAHEFRIGNHHRREADQQRLLRVYVATAQQDVRSSRETDVPREEVTDTRIRAEPATHIARGQLRR